MSNDIALLNEDAALPAHLQKYQAKAAAEAAQLVTGFNSAPKVSIRGKQFRFDRDGNEVALPMGTPLDCVIIAIDPPEGMAKSFYHGSFKADSADAPDCFSTDGKQPDSTVVQPICRSCHECPNNVFGSGHNEQGEVTKGKACSDHKNLFIVEAGAVDGDVFALRVPATSLKNLSTYGRRLAGAGVPPQVVATRITFSDATHPQLSFEALNYLDEKQADFSVKRSESKAVQLLLPSKNQLPRGDNANALPAPPEDAPLEIAPPPKAEPVYVLTAKAGTTTKEQFYAKNWTDELLIEHGYMEIQE